jgi:hypothetical protein
MTNKIKVYVNADSRFAEVFFEADVAIAHAIVNRRQCGVVAGLVEVSLNKNQDIMEAARSAVSKAYEGRTVAFPNDALTKALRGTHEAEIEKVKDAA